MVSCPPNREMSALGDDGRKDLGVGGPQQQCRVLQEIAHADGGDEHGQNGGCPQRLIGQPLDHDAQNGTDDDGQDHAHNGGSSNRVVA